MTTSTDPGPRSTLTATETSFHVEAYEKVDYSLVYVDGVFDPRNSQLAERYQTWGRCLMVVDDAVHTLYREQIEAYFDHHGLELTVLRLELDETRKT